MLIYLYTKTQILNFCFILIFVTDFKTASCLFILRPRIAFGEMQLHFSSVSTTYIHTRAQTLGKEIAIRQTKPKEDQEVSRLKKGG